VQDFATIQGSKIFNSIGPFTSNVCPFTKINSVKPTGDSKSLVHVKPEWQLQVHVLVDWPAWRSIKTKWNAVVSPYCKNKKQMIAIVKRPHLISSTWRLSKGRNIKGWLQSNCRSVFYPQPWCPRCCADPCFTGWPLDCPGVSPSERGRRGRYSVNMSWKMWR